MDLKDTYNKIAEEWFADHKRDDWWIEGADVFCAGLKKGDSVLDAGCGGGFKSNYLAKKGFHVTGIDFSENLIAIAQREYKSPEFLVMDMRDVLNLGRQFEAVFAQASLLHISKEEILPTLKGLAAVLKGGGSLYVAVKGKRHGDPEEAILKEDDYGYQYERFLSYFTMDELKGYFKSLGLEAIYENSKTFGKTEWLQLIGKKKGLML